MNYQQCPVCIAEFKVYPSQKRKYCSVTCMKKGYQTQLKGNNNPNFKGKPQKTCELCGIPISKNAKSRCSACRDIGKINSFAGKKHSDKTKKHLSTLRRGKDSGNWRGRKHTKESKDKISKRKKELWHNYSKEEKTKIKSILMRGLKKQLSRMETLPEKEISSILNEHNVQFEKNKILYGKFFVDFYVNNSKTIIEVFGDYWHCNPEKYYSANEHQKKQIKKDESRLAYLRKCGHEVIVIWENDILKNKDNVNNVLRHIWNI